VTRRSAHLNLPVKKHYLGFGLTPIFVK